MFEQVDEKWYFFPLDVQYTVPPTLTEPCAEELEPPDELELEFDEALFKLPDELELEFDEALLLLLGL